MSATETIEVVVHHELAPGTHAQILEAITAFLTNPALIDATLSIHMFRYLALGDQWQPVRRAHVELRATTYLTATGGLDE